MQGLGTELSLGLIIVILAKDVIVPLIINWRKQGKLTLKTQKIVVPNNPGNTKPGTAKKCIDHGEKLTELKTEINNIKEDITEMKKNNREDHKEIFKLINK